MHPKVVKWFCQSEPIHPFKIALFVTGRIYFRWILDGIDYEEEMDNSINNMTLLLRQWYENIAKGTTDPRVEFISQFTNLEHITIPESSLSIKFKISTKHRHLDQI